MLTKANYHLAVQIGFALLGLIDVAFLAHLLSPQDFGVAVLVISISQIVYGVLEIRWWEFVAVGNTNSNLTLAQSRATAIYDFVAYLCALGVSVLAGIQFFQRDISWTLLIAFVGLTPNVLNGNRIFLQYVKRGGVFLHVITTIRITFSIFLLLAASEQDDRVLVPVIFLVFTVFYVIWLSVSVLHPSSLGINHATLKPKDFLFQIKNSLASSFASSLLRHADTLLIGYLVGPIQLGTYRLWQLAYSPISLFAEISSQKLLTKTSMGPKMSKLFRFSFLTNIIVISVLAACGILSLVLLFDQVARNFSEGLFVLVIYFLAFENTFLKTHLILKSGYKVFNKIIWISVGMYLLMFCLLWNFLGGTLSILLTRIIVNFFLRITLTKYLKVGLYRRNQIIR